MSKPLIALLTNNDDDVYCFRKELIEGLLAEGYEMLISCPNGPKFELMKDIPYIYDDPVIDRRGTNLWACPASNHNLRSAVILPFKIVFDTHYIYPPVVG